MSTFISGFLISFSLILAIGSQNAFVLRQGLKREHVFIICSICSISDAILIIAGVLGFAVFIASYPWIADVARYAGIAFLMVYGSNSFWSAWKASSGMEASKDTHASLYKNVAICLAFTWLNPHVYLDTVIFIGSVSTQFATERLAFILGSISASLIFFFSLGYGARILEPIFKKPVSWRILDFMIGVVMFAIAITVIFQ